jgi:hypothetical protein
MRGRLQVDKRGLQDIPYDRVITPEARSEGRHPNRRQEMVLLLISGFD